MDRIARMTATSMVPWAAIIAFLARLVLGGCSLSHLLGIPKPAGCEGAVVPITGD